MKEFKITHRERLVGTYYIEAENEQDAMIKYWNMVMTGNIDYSDMDAVDSSDEVKEVEQ